MVLPPLTTRTSAGYGDFVPTEPGSKVFWVIYALMAVPLIASFAVRELS
jgi:potassium channel subfamily K